MLTFLVLCSISAAGLTYLAWLLLSISHATVGLNVDALCDRWHGPDSHRVLFQGLALLAIGVALFVAASRAYDYWCVPFLPVRLPVALDNH